MRQAAAEQRRAHTQAVRSAARQAKQQYLSDRAGHAAQLTAELDSQVAQLRGLLAHSLSANDIVSFDRLRVKEVYPPLNLPAEVARPRTPPGSLDSYLAAVKEPSWFGRLIPGWRERHEAALAEAGRRHEDDLAAHRREEARRLAEKARLEQEYVAARDVALDEARRRNKEVAEFEADYRAGAAEAVETYNEMVLERSEYPEGFPQEFDLAYRPGEKELVVEYELPGVKVVPAVGEYKYVKTRDAIDEKPRKQSEVKELYADIVASVALRTLHEVFEADQYNHIEAAVFNGYVRGIDPATGRQARTCLVAAGVDRATFVGFDLRHVDRPSCLRSIGARVSSRPTELLGVTPMSSAAEAGAAPRGRGTSQRSPTSQRSMSSQRPMSSQQSAASRGASSSQPHAGSKPVSAPAGAASDIPRRSLVSIVARYGAEVGGNPRLCQGLLRDFCGEHRREIQVLVRAVDERIPEELARDSASSPAAVLVSRLADRLRDNQGIADDLALWAVRSWAVALGVLAEGDA